MPAPIVEIGSVWVSLQYESGGWAVVKSVTNDIVRFRFVKFIWNGERPGGEINSMIVEHFLALFTPTGESSYFT